MTCSRLLLLLLVLVEFSPRVLAPARFNSLPLLLLLAIDTCYLFLGKSLGIFDFIIGRISLFILEFLYCC